MSEYQTHTPLTFEQACSLEVGDKVLCIDQGDWPGCLVPGLVYPVRWKNGRQPVISLTKESEFWLSPQTCHLFAALPRAPTAEAPAPEQALKQASAPAPAQQIPHPILEKVRAQLEKELRERANNSLGGTWELGWQNCAMMILREIGCVVLPEVPAVPLKVVWSTHGEKDPTP
jgi:hypothetical protein